MLEILADEQSCFYLLTILELKSQKPPRFHSVRLQTLLVIRLFNLITESARKRSIVRVLKTYLYLIPVYCLSHKRVSRLFINFSTKNWRHEK